MFRTLIISLLIANECLASHHIERASNDSSIVMQLDFQDFFVNDKVDLLIDNCLVVKNVTLNSDKILD